MGMGIAMSIGMGICMGIGIGMVTSIVLGRCNFMGRGRATAMGFGIATDMVMCKSIGWSWSRSLQLHDHGEDVVDDNDGNCWLMQPL